MGDVFESTDSVRTARPLKYAQHATFREPLQLELGGRLPEVTVAARSATEFDITFTGDSGMSQHFSLTCFQTPGAHIPGYGGGSPRRSG